MRWTPGGLSGDVEDRRSSGGGGFGFGGGLGWGGLLLLLIISLVTGRNYIGAYLLGGGGAGQTQSQQHRAASPDEERSAQLVSFVLDDAQKTWPDLLAQRGVRYRHAKLVLYRGATYSGCGTARSATGPFYCPEDEKVYIDLDFWDDLRRFGASGEFAQAYVVAHEIGHHVQKILGTESQVRQLMQQNPTQQNQLSVDLELQADCYAGVWGHSTEQRNIIDQSDVDAGLRAAAAVGDDHLQKMAGRAVSPDSFTHGSSQQREDWFKKGLDSGDIKACNTFAGQ
ncbi:MAG TPA: neutral zinc metallopeptidase [Terriglobales bacterium]